MTKKWTRGKELEGPGPNHHEEAYSKLECLVLEDGYERTDAGIVHEKFCNRYQFTEGVVGATDEDIDYYSDDYARPNGPLQWMDGRPRALGLRIGCVESGRPTRGFLSAVSKTMCTLTCDEGYHAVYAHGGHYHAYCHDKRHGKGKGGDDAECEPVVRELRCGIDGGDPYMDKDEKGMTDLICRKDDAEHSAHSVKSKAPKEAKKKGGHGEGLRTTLAAKGAAGGSSVMLTGVVGVVAGMVGAMVAMVVQARMQRTFLPATQTLAGERTSLLRGRSEPDAQTV